MNGWLDAALVATLLLVPCGCVAARATIADAVVALEAASSVAVLALMLLAEGLHETFLWDLAIVLAALQLPGALLFTRTLERGV
jgi:multisubunit Na+/H+ antiporter MnhF subunit